MAPSAAPPCAAPSSAPGFGGERGATGRELSEDAAPALPHAAAPWCIWRMWGVGGGGRLLDILKILEYLETLKSLEIWAILKIGENGTFGKKIWKSENLGKCWRCCASRAICAILGKMAVWAI